MSETDPFAWFGRVLAEAEATGISDPNAMVLASVDASGRPSSRVVLLKGFDHRGFVFYTNLESCKGEQIRARPEVCLNFFWRELSQQVRIEGRAELVDDAEADAYFSSRPHGSQIGAWASKQSRPLAGRGELLSAVAAVEARYLGRPVPRPPHWSGFRVVPERFEFWVGRVFRLHDRTVFERSPEGWRSFRLYP